MSRRAATSRSTPAPTGGWNTSASQADMAIDDAIMMQNWFPDTDRLILRKGSASHATGIGSAVETLMTYSAEDGSEEMFAIAGGAVYDVSATGAVGAAVVSGLSNSRFEWTQIGTAGGQFLIACNGLDDPLLYDGSTWSTTSITGPSQDTFVCVTHHQRRLWFGVRDSLTAYYLAVDSIAGAATAFYLGPVARRGGYITTIGTWTRDGGAGPDDVAVFVTSEGEVIVYSGTNPSSASTWGLVGVFQVGKPIGRRCLVKLGADLAILTEDGVLPLTQAMATEQAQQSAIAISKNINSAVNTAVSRYRDIFGWQMIAHSATKQLLINVPISTTTAEQFVFNTLSGAACKFTGWHARCLTTFGDGLYFGTSGGDVVKANTGTTDQGAAIEGDCIQAFSYFNSPATTKYFKRVNIILQGDADPTPALQVYTDFNLGTFIATPQQTPTSLAIFGSAIFGTSVFGGANSTWQAWRIVEGEGRAAAIRVRVSTTVGTPAWVATHWTFVAGGQL